MWEIVSNLVAFLENLNFNQITNLMQFEQILSDLNFQK